jgi:hypothetical protein
MHTYISYKRKPPNTDCKWRRGKEDKNVMRKVNLLKDTVHINGNIAMKTPYVINIY